MAFYGNIIGRNVEDDNFMVESERFNGPVVLSRSKDLDYSVGNTIIFGAVSDKYDPLVAKNHTLAWKADITGSVIRTALLDAYNPDFSSLVIYNPSYLYCFAAVARRRNRVHEIIGMIPGYEDGKSEGSFCHPHRNHKYRKHGKNYRLKREFAPGGLEGVLFVPVEGIAYEKRIEKELFKKLVIDSRLARI